MIMQKDKELEVSVARQPKIDEYLLWEYDMDKIDLDQCIGIYKYLERKFPLNTVVALPKDNSILETLSREDILNIIKTLEDLVNNK